MYKKTEQGNVIEIVIIVVLLLAVGGLVAWRVMDGNKNQSTTAGSSQTSSSDSQNNQSDPYAGWKIYENKEAGFSVRYPASWTSKPNTSDATSDTLTYLDDPTTQDTETPADITVSSEHSTAGTSGYQLTSGVILAWKSTKYNAWDYGLAKTDILGTWTETVNSIPIQGYQIMAQGPYTAIAFVIGDKVNGLSFSASDKDHLSADQWKIIRSIRQL